MQTKAAQINDLVHFGKSQCKFLTIKEESLKGVKMTWSIFNFKSPLGSLTEEYGTVNSAFNETEGTLHMNSLKAEFAIQDILILQIYFSYCY